MMFSGRNNVIYEVFRRHFTPLKDYRNGRKVPFLRVESGIGKT